MTYSSGAKILADIIEEIAEGLIALANWEDGDLTWTTADKTANNAKRCLRYTGDAADIWIALEAINTSSQVYVTPTRYAKGLRVTFSASWDGGYPPTNQQTFLPFELHTTTVIGDLATLLLTYYLWYDANGFVITAKPEPWGDLYQQSFFLAVERVATKEYVDGYSNFYCAVDLNTYEYYDKGSSPTYVCRPYLRPFNFQYPDDAVDRDTISFYNHGVNHPEFLRAMKSSGNGKSYYVKPLYQNEDGPNDPIATADMWFGWSEEKGLVDGDIVAIEGETTKYLCKALDSPDSANRLDYAIKKVA